MGAVGLGLTYNSSNINAAQQTPNFKKSNNGDFEQTLKVEKAKADLKSNLNSNVKSKEVSHPSKITSAKPSASVSKNYLAPPQKTDVNGTNFALKELSTELAEQVVGILMTYAMNPDGTFEGGFAENLYSQEANVEKVKSVTRDLIEDLSDQFYEESLRMYEAGKKDETGKQ